MFERLDHVALLTSDVAASVAFYRDWAGMEVIHERGEGAQVRWIRLTDHTDGLIIVLIETSEKRPLGYTDHFGFHVRSRADVDAIASRAGAAGVLVQEARYGGAVIGYFCTIRDPDGNQIEFSCEQLKA